MSDEEVTIRLTVNEFVVLDEFLRRYSATGELTIEDQAEQQALWALECIFERDPNRSESWPSLSEARMALRFPKD